MAVLTVLTVLMVMPLAVSARATRTSASDVYVKGYTKKNGTYVAPHYRTPPNNTLLDNYSCIDQGRCGTGVSGGTTYTAPSVSAPTIKTTSGCPDNSTLNGTMCVCNAGYQKSTTSNVCVSSDSVCEYGYGQSFFDVAMSQCVCKSGYTMTQYTGFKYCTIASYTCPVNSTLNGSQCICNEGYTVGQDKASCISLKDQCTQRYGDTVYFDSTDSRCYCIVGREYDQATDTCKVSNTTSEKLILTSYNTNIRQSASTKGKLLGTVAAKTWCDLLKDGGAWVNVKCGNKTGWMKKSLVKVQ